MTLSQLHIRKFLDALGSIRSKEARKFMEAFGGDSLRRAFTTTDEEEA